MLIPIFYLTIILIKGKVVSELIVILSTVSYVYVDTKKNEGRLKGSGLVTLRRQKATRPNDTRLLHCYGLRHNGNMITQSC